MTKIVTFYNHKGGVSKTTTTFNVAHLAAQSGKRVLVVDADPQCNLTELMLSKTIQELDSTAEQTGVLNELPGSTLLDILRPRIEGEIPSVDVNKVQTVPITTNLDIIRGDVSINSIEDSLAEAHIQRFSGKVHEKRTYVAIGDLLTRIGITKAYDLIIIDVGPSSGSLTRSCFLSCDAFLVPVSPDRFNVQAIGTLAVIIERWLREHAEIYDDFVALGLPVRKGKPKFLGTIAQQFKMIKGRPKPGYRLWMQRIPVAVTDQLLPVLKRYSNEERDLSSGLSSTNISVTEIPDFQSLAPLMQEFGKPVFAIDRDDTAAITDSKVPWSGATWTDAEIRMRSFRDCYQQILTRIESQI